MMEIVAVCALVLVICERIYSRSYPPAPSRRPGEMVDVSMERLRAAMKKDTGR